MKHVQILPPEIISKIAAGEVIERPASVVKELLENSLDAKADTIELHLKDSGKTLIHLKDNGEGISHEDLPTIFQRHATSKLKTADDLFAIRSLGFRGEALYSIAAISDIELESKTKDQETGFSMALHGGKEKNLRPCAMNAQGTQIKIKELFFNTPARKKFLKSNSAEINQILNIFLPYTLLHHDARFTLTHQGKTLIDLAPASDRSARVADSLHLNKEHFLECSHSIDDKDTKIELLLGDINIKRNRRDMQFVFVNNRPVFNKSISFHINRVYRLLMPPDEFPFFVINISMPAKDIDVNIHPTKREIKIKDEQTLCQVLRSLCEQTLMSAGQIKKIGTSYVFSNSGGSSNTFVSRDVFSGLKTAEYEFDSPVDRDTHSFETSSRDYAFPKEQLQNFFIPSDIDLNNSGNLANKLRDARYIGAFINKYLFFESGSSLLLVDQHAAQERISYEQLLTQIQKGKVEVQPLLAPILVTLSPQEMILWEELKEKLEEVGLSTTQFDPQTVAVNSHPNLVNKPDKALKDLLAGDDTASVNHEQIARRACRSSIMTGDRLSKEQAEYQRQQLMKCLDPFTCPHGRPIVVELTEDFLDKQFLRM